MVYIFEGLDRCGKSTQIELLKQKLEEEGKAVFIIHCEAIKTNKGPEWNKEVSKQKYKSLIEMIDKYAADTETCLIFDRSHIGEAVYSPMYRNYSGDYVFEYERFIKHPEKVLTFFMVDEPSKVIARDDGLSFSTDTEKKETELKYFYMAFEKTRTTGIWVNLSETGDIEEVSKEVNKYVKARS